MDKKICLECLQGVHKSGDRELMYEQVFMKSLGYFTYAEFICNGCVDYLSQNEFKGAPKESFRNFTFLCGHFKWFFNKLKRDAGEELLDRYQTVFDMKSAYIAETMKKVYENPDDMKEICDKTLNKIYKWVIGKDLVLSKNMLVGDIRTGKKR